MNGSEVVATTADPAFAVSCEGTIIAWNPAASMVLGYPRVEVLNRCCWTILEGQDPFSNRYCDKACPLRRMAARGEPIHKSRMSFRTASGAFRQFSLSSIVVRGKHGREVVHLLEDLAAGEQDDDSVASVSGGANGGARLSSRQLEVLQHLANGRGTKQIAEALCISPSTVRHHIQCILGRLKAHHRLEAVALARRIGLV